MNVKASAAALAVVVASATGAFAQSLQPAISSAWDDMEISQNECFDRGRSTFERLRFTRIEKVGNSVFADFGNFQFAIRCVSDKRMYYVYGGGPGDQDKRLDEIINDIKSSFRR